MADEQLVADAVKFLERLVGECDGGPDTHSWRTCRRCLAEFHVENREPFALRLLGVAIEALRARSCSTCRWALVRGDKLFCRNSAEMFGCGTVAPTFDRRVPHNFCCALYQRRESTS